MPDETRAAIPSDVYEDDHSDRDGVGRFSRLDGTDYDEVTAFLRDRVAFTAREWAVARLCADFRTGTGVEMTNVGEHLPALVPFMDEPYTKQAVCSARRDFVEKVREAGATLLYGAYADFLTAEEVDDLLYSATEVAKFLIEVEGGTLDCGRELAAERRIREAMAAVHEASLELRYDRCPNCGETLCEDAVASNTDAS